MGSATAQTQRGEPSLLPPFPQMLLCKKAKPTRHAVLFNDVHGRRFHMLDQEFTVSGSLVSFTPASSWCPWCCLGFISSLTSRSHAATCQGTSAHVCQWQRHCCFTKALNVNTACPEHGIQSLATQRLVNCHEVGYTQHSNPTCNSCAYTSWIHSTA